MECAALPGAAREERLRHWIDAYAGAVMKTCYAYLMDRALAEDAMQDTFWKAWRHMADFENRRMENEKAWLMRIAIHTCIDYRRSAWFRHVDRYQTPDTLPEGAVKVDWQENTLAFDVCRLPDRLKQVVLLYFYQGLTLQETAQALGLTKSTVHRRIEKALKELKMRQTGGEDREA